MHKNSYSAVSTRLIRNKVISATAAKKMFLERTLGLAIAIAKFLIDSLCSHKFVKIRYKYLLADVIEQRKNKILYLFIYLFIGNSR